MKIGMKLRNLRIARELTLEDMANIMEATPVSVYYWESGQRSPKIKYLQRICERYGIDLSTFIDEDNDIFDSDLPRNVTKMPQTRTVPLIGDIACGDPIAALEDGSQTVQMPENIRADLALTCRGDSMINARIFDGDIVYIRRQPDIESGEIAAVIIDGEATLKRVYKFPDHILLQPENPAYRPIVLWEQDLDTVRILGKAVAFTSTII